MKKFAILLILIVLLLVEQVVSRPKEKPAFLNDIRSLAMGGAGIANARGSFSHIYNPALLANQKFSITIPCFQLELSEKFFDILDYVNDNKENFKKLNKKTLNVQKEERDEIINQLRIDAIKFDNIWYGTSISPCIGAVTQNIGISVYNVASVVEKIDVGIIVPKIKLYALNDLVISLAYGNYVNEKLSLGIGAKIINRREVPEYKIKVEEFNRYDSYKEILEQVDNKIQKGKTGLNFDIGALYKINKNWRLAAVVQDLLGRVGTFNIPTNFKLGAVYQHNKNFVFAADIEDFFNFDGDKFVNRIYFGCEYTLPVISLRLGFGQGYPAVGVGLNLWLVDLGYTFYSTEITDTPGQKGESYHTVGFKLWFQ